MPRRVKGEAATQGVDVAAFKPEDYAAFISQIELHSIWLSEASIKNHQGAVAPDQGEYSFETRTRWTPHGGGFTAWHDYRIRLQRPNVVDEQPYLEIEVRFGVDFESRLEMNDTIFATFREINLPLNTWPYLRSFIADTLGRLNWAPITLPAFKVGAPAKETPLPDETTAPVRSRRRRTSTVKQPS